MSEKGITGSDPILSMFQTERILKSIIDYQNTGYKNAIGINVSPLPLQHIE